VWLLLFVDSAVETGSDAPPWWFLGAIVLAILAAALFTMRLAINRGRRRRNKIACPSCGAPIQRSWVRCPSCGAEPSGAAGAPYAGPPVLEFTKGPLGGRTFPLDRDVTTVGSGDTNNLVLQDTGVSRKHVGIRRVDGGFELADLGSTNGVFVNGEKSARRRLVSGDVIRIGTSEAVFRG